MNLHNPMGGGKISSSKAFYPAVDLYKFIAALLVVAIHSKPFGDGAIETYYLSAFCRVAVPFFFCFSSFIFYKNQKNIKDYVWRMIKLYLIWFAIELPIIYLRFFDDGLTTESILVFAKGLIWRNTFFASWFITASWQGMLITYYLFKVFGNRATYIIGIICMIIAAFSSLYNGLIPGGQLKDILNFLELEDSFVTAIPYCIIGKLIAQDKDCEGIFRTAIVLCIGLLTGIFETTCMIGTEKNNDVFFSLPIITYCTVILLTKVKKLSIPAVALKYMRNMSILIYLLHNIFIRLLHSCISENYIIFAITIILSVSSAYIIVRLSTNFDLLKRIY